MGSLGLLKNEDLIRDYFGAGYHYSRVSPSYPRILQLINRVSVAVGIIVPPYHAIQCFTQYARTRRGRTP